MLWKWDWSSTTRGLVFQKPLDRTLCFFVSHMVGINVMLHAMCVQPKWTTPSSLNGPVILACLFKFFGRKRVCCPTPGRDGGPGVDGWMGGGGGLHQTVDSNPSVIYTTSQSQHGAHEPPVLSPPTSQLRAEGIQWLIASAGRACCSRWGQGLLLKWINL